MTIKLTHAQATVLKLIQRGVRSSPPLSHHTVKALEAKGYIKENVVNGQVFYLPTEKGKNFG